MKPLTPGQINDDESWGELPEIVGWRHQGSEKSLPAVSTIKGDSIPPTLPRKSASWTLSPALGMVTDRAGQRPSPGSQIRKSIQVPHQAFHLGREKTCQVAQRMFPGENLSRTVQHVIPACEVGPRNNLSTTGRQSKDWRPSGKVGNWISPLCPGQRGLDICWYGLTLLLTGWGPSPARQKRRKK